MPVARDRGRSLPIACAALVLFAGGETDLQQVSPLIWLLIALSAAGAFVTYAILVYAVWRFRDPTTRRRNYG